MSNGLAGMNWETMAIHMTTAVDLHVDAGVEGAYRPAREARGSQ